MNFCSCTSPRSPLSHLQMILNDIYDMYYRFNYNMSSALDKISRNISATNGVQMYKCVILFYNNNTSNIIRRLRDEGRYRQNERQIIGHALCFNDYRVIVLELEVTHAFLNQKMDKVRYKKIAKSIVYEAVRELQRFLSQNCKIQISKLNNNQLQSISKQLLNSQSLLPFDQSVTFRALIRIISRLSSITMSEYFAAQLYATLMNILIQKINNNKIEADQIKHTQVGSFQLEEQLAVRAEKRQSQTKQLKQIWNSVYQSFLIQQVKHQQSRFVNIRDSFKLKFPQNKELFTSQSLKNRYYTILRTAIKQLKAIVNTKRDRLPQMIMLDNDRIRSIIKSERGASVRLLLLDIYQMGERRIDQWLIGKTIQRVNECVLAREDIQLSARAPEDKVQNGLKDY